jgi:DNA polymerase-3 subunit beta
MKIVCNREKFLSGFLIVSGLVPTRSPKDILSNIKLEAIDGKLVLMATDQEAGIRLEIPDVDIQTPGKALLNVQRIGNILREASDDTLTFETTSNSLDIHGVNSEFHLQLANPDEYPSVGKFLEDSYFEMPAIAFREMVRRTIFATDTESTRYQLGGVLFEMEGEDITTVATDGRRLACMRGRGASVNGFKNVGASTIVPTKTLQTIERSIADSDSNVKIAARSNDILFKTDRCMLFSRLVEGRYPNWKSVIPSEEGRTRISGLVGPFFASVRQASIVADPESRGIEFQFGNGSMIVGAKTADVGQSRVEIPIDFHEAPLALTMDYRFVLDFFKVLPPESTFNLLVKSNTEPALYNTDDGYTYVVMPMSRH